MGRHSTIVAFGILLTACTQSVSNSSLVPSEQLKGIHLRQNIGKMEVISMSYGEWNSAIRFNGAATITGEYYDASAEGGMGPRGICMFNLDPETKIGLPTRHYADAQELEKGLPDLTIFAATAGDYIGSICFDREDAVKKGFPRSTKGTATVVIDNFVLDLVGSEGSFHSANLAKVITVEAQEPVENVE